MPIRFPIYLAVLLCTLSASQRCVVPSCSWSTGQPLIKVRRTTSLLPNNKGILVYAASDAVLRRRAFMGCDVAIVDTSLDASCWTKGL